MSYCSDAVAAEAINPLPDAVERGELRACQIRGDGDTTNVDGIGFVGQALCKNVGVVQAGQLAPQPVLSVSGTEWWIPIGASVGTLVLGAILGFVFGWFTQERRLAFERDQVARNDMTAAAAEFIDTASDLMWKFDSVLARYGDISRDARVVDTELDVLYDANAALQGRVTRVEFAFGAGEASALARAISGKFFITLMTLEMLFTGIKSSAPIDLSLEQRRITGLGLTNTRAGIGRFVEASRQQRETLSSSPTDEIDLGPPYCGEVGVATARDMRKLELRAGRIAQTCSCRGADQRDESHLGEWSPESPTS